MAIPTTTSRTRPLEASPARQVPPEHRPRRLRIVLGIALVVILLAELAVRMVEDRLPPPPDWYTPEYGLKEEQVAALSERTDGASVVFLGSSVIDVSIDASAIEAPEGSTRPAYNAGLIGANLEMVDVWSQHVIEPALRPDVAFLALSSRDLNRNGAGLESQTPGFYDLPAVRRILGTESVLERIERWAGETSHLIRYRKVLRRPLEALFGYDPPDRNVVMNGDLGQELHLLDLEYQGDADVERFFRAEPLLGFALSEAQLAAVRRTVERLTADGVRVVLLDVPVTEQYVALHPRGAADYLDYEVAINVLASQLGVDLIDAGTWTEVSFSDPLHLNGVGADNLTSLVDGYLAGEGVVLPEGAAAPAPLEGAVAEPVTVP